MHLLTTLALAFISTNLFAWPFDLNGRWIAPCIQEEEAGQYYYRQTSLEFRNGNSILLGQNSKKEDCSDSPHSFMVLGSYKFPLGGVPFHWHIDLKVKGSYLILHQQQYVDYYNKIKYCGHTDWKLNEPRELTNKGCGGNGLYEPGTTLYQIYRRWGKNLRIGKMEGELNGLTPETRPVEFEPKYPFRLQKPQ